MTVGSRLNALVLTEKCIGARCPCHENLIPFSDHALLLSDAGWGLAIVHRSDLLPYGPQAQSRYYRYELQRVALMELSPVNLYLGQFPPKQGDSGLVNIALERPLATVIMNMDKIWYVHCNHRPLRKRFPAIYQKIMEKSSCKAYVFSSFVLLS